MLTSLVGGGWVLGARTCFLATLRWVPITGECLLVALLSAHRALRARHIAAGVNPLRAGIRCRNVVYLFLWAWFLVAGIFLLFAVSSPEVGYSGAAL